MKQEKEFDRSICFTFYNDFHEQIMDVKRDFGLEEAFKVYEAIVNYGLYGIEIEKGRIRTLVSNTTISKIEDSQVNRSKWFKGENFEMTKVVAEYMRDHPGVSQRTIVAATGVSKTKVAKVQKNIKDSGLNGIQEYLNHIVYPHLNNCNTDSNSYSTNDSYSNIVTETTTSPKDQSLDSGSQTESATPPTESSTPAPTETETELSKMDIYNNQVTVIKLYRNRKKIKEIVDETGFEYGFVNDTVDWYMNNGKKYPDKPTETKTFDVPLMNGGYLSRTKDELFNNATNKGKLTMDDIDWQKLEQEYVMYGIAPQMIKQLVSEFKQKLKNMHNITIFPHAI